MLKPNAVLFGEALPQDVLQEASRRSAESDLFIVVGSTLIVYPAAYMPQYAVQSGAKLIIVNLSDTPMDAQATVLIRAKAGEAMSRIVDKVKDRLEER
jgi:NAD-dependent deacetylase